MSRTTKACKAWEAEAEQVLEANRTTMNELREARRRAEVDRRLALIEANKGSGVRFNRIWG